MYVVCEEPYTVWRRSMAKKLFPDIGLLAFGSEMTVNITPIMLLTFMDRKLCCSAIGWHYCYHNT